MVSTIRRQITIFMSVSYQRIFDYSSRVLYQRASCNGYIYLTVPINTLAIATAVCISGWQQDGKFRNKLEESTEKRA